MSDKEEKKTAHKSLKNLPAKSKDAKSLELKKKVWECYANGITNFRVISEKTGVPLPTAHRWVKEELKFLAEKRRELSEEFLEAELQRLDFMLETCMKDVTTQVLLTKEYEGNRLQNVTQLIDRVDTKVVDAILKIQERRARYLGLDLITKEDKKYDFDLAEILETAMKMQQEDKKVIQDAEFKVKDEESMAE